MGQELYSMTTGRIQYNHILIFISIFMLRKKNYKKTLQKYFPCGWHGALRIMWDFYVSFDSFIENIFYFAIRKELLSPNNLAFVCGALIRI